MKRGLKIIAAVLGALGSLVLVASVFFKFGLHGPGPLLTPRFALFDVVKDIPSHLSWLIRFVLCSAAVIPLRALQWGSTLPRPVPFKERYHLVAIGAFVHNALPGKLGDFFRSFLMARSQKLPFVVVLGSVAVGKLLEFAALMLLVALSLLGPFGQVMSRFGGALSVAAAVCVGLVILVLCLARYALPIAYALEGRHRLARLRRFLIQASEGLGTARSASALLKALALSVGPVLAPALAYGFALHRLGVHDGLFAGAVVLGAIAVGQGVPGLPMGVGIYYFVTSWAARSLGASAADAAAFSALTHFGTFATQLAVGGTSVWARKLKWSDLRRRKDAASEAAKALDDAPVPA